MQVERPAHLNDRGKASRPRCEAQFLRHVSSLHRAGSPEQVLPAPMIDAVDHWYPAAPTAEPGIRQMDG
jgi:hypothetical protein